MGADLLSDGRVGSMTVEKLVELPAHPAGGFTGRELAGSDDLLRLPGAVTLVENAVSVSVGVVGSAAVGAVFPEPLVPGVVQIHNHGAISFHSVGGG